MSQSSSATALISYEPSEPGKLDWRHESITIKRTDPGPNEVLVRMLAAGVCHTDIVCGSVPTGVFGAYPKVLGHEGSGYVLAIGSDVKSVNVGDPVLLSYTYCGKCDKCEDSEETYCQKFNVENAECGVKIWDAKQGEIGGKFFGQSSFASLSLVEERSVVNVKGLVKDGDDEELKKFSPLGCGLMTGSGAITNTAKARQRDSILVTGMGAVGLGAVMAAKIQGCKTIIAVDRIASRLELAKELGATHILDTSSYDISREDYAKDVAIVIKDLSQNGEINYAFDTTGIIPLMNASIKSLSKRGKLIQIGIPVTTTGDSLPLDVMDFFGGTKRFEINYLGDSLAREQIPKMIQWYRDGKFPFDRFIKFYAAKDFEKALNDMKGEVIKPILVH